jgi:Tol biopolymer transport system component
MSVMRPGLRLAVAAAIAAGIAFVLAVAGATMWQASPPAQAQFTHCGDGVALIEWESGTVTLTPNTGFAGTAFTVEVAGIPTDIQTRAIEVLWDWDVAEPDEELIASDGLAADQTSITLDARVPEDAAADSYWVAACWERPGADPSVDRWFYKRATFAVEEPTPTPVFTPTPSPTASLTPEPDFTPTATPEPTAKVLNCPPANKWAIAVWDGADTGVEEALNACGEGAVDSAYYIDPDSQQWLRYLAGRPELSNLEALGDMQGVIVHGNPEAQPGEWFMPGPAANEMRNCPQPGKWVISVWDSADDIDTAGAISFCAEEIDFAYELDPESQQWRRWFAGLPEISNFETVKGGEGLLAHGKAEPPAPVERIAFVSNRDANDLEIFAVNSDGTDLTNLTKSPGADDTPAWSPDGSKIAFGSYRDGNWEIYVMNPDGSGPTRLTTDPTDDEQPVWSPDGSRIAFVSWRSGASELWVMNADGSGQTRLSWFPSGGPTDPTWSPDGSKVAFGSWGDIYVASAVAAGQAVPVATNLTNIAPSLMAIEPAWSQDGAKIAYRCCDDDNWEIYVMNADGTGRTNLTNSPGWDSGHTWSPDGTQIAFNSGRDGNDQIYVMKSDGTSATRLTSSADAKHNPSWSPDSSRLVVECTISTNAEVCVVDANGVTNVSNHPWVDTEPVWSP